MPFLHLLLFLQLHHQLPICLPRPQQERKPARRHSEIPSGLDRVAAAQQLRHTNPLLQRALMGVAERIHRYEQRRHISGCATVGIAGGVAWMELSATALLRIPHYTFRQQNHPRLGITGILMQNESKWNEN